MPLREFLVEHQGPGRSPKLNIFYANAEADAASQINDLNAFLSAWKTWAVTGSNSRIVPEQRILNEGSGALEGLEFNPGGVIHNGTATGSPVADSSQVLIRWSTPDIVNGRFVRGRTFLPSMTAGQLVGGNVSSNVVTAMQTAATSLVNGTEGWVIWHRPKDGAGGSAHGMNAGSVWSELAVLRRRRG